MPSVLVVWMAAIALAIARFVQATVCDTPWSTVYPLLNSTGEAAPGVRCSGLSELYGCNHKNFCCFDISPSQLGCFPSNPSFIDCVGLSMGDCAAAADAASCWWDGQNCRRGCPSGYNDTYTPRDLCDALTELQQPQPWSTFLAFSALEWAPQKNCSLFVTQQGCKVQNYCCWVQQTSTCIPSNEQRIECPGRTQDSCQSYPTLCLWTGSACARVMPATADSDALCATLVAAWQQPRNVLMIIVDDLRAELNLAYGQKNVITPNMDAFAVRPGTLVFDRVHSQFPICSPSRNSFLSGRSPDAINCLNQLNGLRNLPGSMQWVTMPQLFKNNGFFSTGGGKVFHLNHDDPLSWNSYFFNNVDQGTGCTDDPNAVPVIMRGGTPFSPFWAVCTSPSGMNQFLDYQVLGAALTQLDSLAAKAQPFFMAVGFYRPHLPYHMPIRFWNQYAPYWHTISPEYPNGPQPQSSYTPFFFDADSDVYAFNPQLTPWHILPVDPQLVLRTGYLTSVTLMDDVVGMLLSRVDKNGLRDSTMVVFYGDHGFLLGENGLWAKNQLFQQATQVPLLMYVPWLAPLANNSASGLMTTRFPLHVELLDLYRTLAGFFNLAVDPAIEGTDHSDNIARYIQGLEAPQSGSSTPDAAFSEVVRCYDTGVADCNWAQTPGINRVGYSVRTVQWRYTVWLAAVNAKAQFTSVLGQELYDHSNDTAPWLLNFDVEYENVASENLDVCASMFQMVQQRYMRAPAAGRRLLYDDAERLDL